MGYKERIPMGDRKDSYEMVVLQEQLKIIDKKLNEGIQSMINLKDKENGNANK